MDLAIQGGLSPPRLPVSPPGPSNVSLSCQRCRDESCAVPGSRPVGSPVGIGTIGIVVPGLPTTVFFIVAAACFSRSSPRFEQWVLDRPGIGPMVRDYRSGLGMPRKAKTAAIASIAVVCSLSAFVTTERMVAANDHPRRRRGRHRVDPLACPDPARRPIEPGAARGRPLVPDRGHRRGDHLARPPRRHGGQVRRDRLRDRRADLRTDPRRRRARLLRRHVPRRPAVALGQPHRGATPSWPPCRPARRSCSRPGPSARAACGCRDRRVRAT